MKRATISTRAKSDLRDIWSYISQGSTDAADRFVDFLVEKCFSLAESPGIGRERKELPVKGLRGFPTRGYLIFYRPTDYGIEVVRIISGWRDIAKLFAEE